MISEEQFIKDFKVLLSCNDEIKLDTDLLDIEEWDSFSATSFLAMINDKYGIKAEPFDVAEAILVEDLYNIVKNH
jgi:acyl carrier protein